MSLGLLGLRLVAGLLFMGHGAQKLFGAFGGPGIDRTAAGFESKGLRPGRLQAWAAALCELLGGLLLVLGLFTPFGAAAVIGVMTAAILTVHARNGVWNTAGGFEYNLVLMAAAFALAGAGPGAWSLDHALGFGLAGADWAIAALAAGLVGGAGASILGRHSDLLQSRHDHRHAGAH